MKTLVKRLIPRGVRYLLKRFLYLPLDTAEWLLGRRDDLTPPRGVLSVEGDFHTIGGEFLAHLIDLCGLKEDDQVLDVGCGVGRMAVPLVGFLSSAGRYEGFDIIPDGIRWCRRKIGAKFPNFNFQQVDVYNKNYNPRGRILAVDFRFPYPDRTFDVVLAASLFTHMLPDDATNYIREIARVLKSDGHCVLTFFLSETKEFDDAAAVSSRFPYDYGVYRVQDQVVPEVALCYQEDFVRGLSLQSNLKISEPILYGSWSGRNHTRSYQDFVVCTPDCPPEIAKT